MTTRSISAIMTGLLCVALITPAVATAQEASPLPSATPTEAAPNAERPLTHAELLDVRGESTQNGWDGRMLVADAVIERDRRSRPKPEGAGGGVAFGSLPRDGQAGDPIVQARKDVRSLYRADGSPITGLLAIELSDRAMELRGTVATPNGTYLTPIEPAAMSVADELPVGALLVAQGWLTSLDTQEPCPAVPKALDRNDSAGFFSPFVRCPGGWLTTEEVTETNPDDPLSPAAFGVPVQHGVFERFAFTEPRFGGPVDQPATYVLRHVASPIGGADPATGWEVIGRLDETADRTVTPPPDEEDGAVPRGLDWEPALERQPPADSWWTDSTAWGGGFASIHTGRDRVITSWASRDGKEWQGASVPRGVRSVRALLRLGDRLALIANEREFDRTWTFDVWTSRDGLAWKRVGRQRVPTPARFDDQTRRRVHGYWWVGDRLVAMATYGPDRCCGLVGDRAFLAARPGARDETFTWSSTRGKEWTRQRTKGVPDAISDYLGRQISEVNGELLVLWGDRKDTIGRSTDGVDWKVAGGYPREMDMYSPAVFARTPSGFVIAGEPKESGPGDGNYLTVWTGTNEGEWERTYERSSSVPESITVVGDTVIIAGSQLDLRDPEFDPPPDFSWLLVSSDGGATWDDTLSWTGTTDWCLRDLTERDGTVMLDLACAPPDAASKHVVTLGSSSSPAPDPVPTPRQALECDTRRDFNSVRDAWAPPSGHETPEAALAEMLTDDFVIPVRGYHELARDADSVLYGFRRSGEVKVAIRATRSEMHHWIPDWLADCGLSEYGRQAEMGPGVWLWANRNDRTIQERRGPADCGQQSVRIIWWTTPSERRRDERIYVRDPEGRFRDQWQAPYLRATTLPANARDTGYRRDGASLWMAPDRDSIYLKDGDRVQRWPRIPRNAIGCA